MVDTLRGISIRTTPQSRPAGAATAKNNAGGFVFEIDPLARLRRWLTLGSEGGTYYTSSKDITLENAQIVMDMAMKDPITLVDTVVEISLAGRAPRQNPCIFALAVAVSLGGDEGRAYALTKVNQVCRTATHLYQFVGYIDPGAENDIRKFRGWGRAFKRAVANWYNQKPVDKLAYQILKYRQREGWMHRDLLALSHANPDIGQPDDSVRDHLYRYAVDTGGKREEAQVEHLNRTHREHYRTWLDHDETVLPALVNDFLEAQSTTASEKSAARRWTEIIQHGNGMSWEMLPDKALGIPAVWEALFDQGIPITALLRQLPRLTNLGLTQDSSYSKAIVKQLTDPAVLKRGRVHPINVLVAQRTYASGRSARGDSTWTPDRKVSNALDQAFYAAYGAVEAARKRILLACDVSGSMGSPASGLPITCREAVGALSLVTLNVEQDADIIGFSDGRQGSFGGWGRPGVATRLDIDPRRRLDDVCQYMAQLSFGATDCALPMLWAMHNKLDFDAIWTLTDNETWFGQIHPWQALEQYRQFVGHDVKYGVIAMTATNFSIADPKDPSSLDISGFDSNVPQLMSDFAAGRI